MSYEGSEEYLCENGHYHIQDCHAADLKECPFCKVKIAYSRAIDETNGEDETMPCTMPGPKREIGFDEHWQADHHGNAYAVKIPRFEPGEHWYRR